MGAFLIGCAVGGATVGAGWWVAAALFALSSAVALRKRAGVAVVALCLFAVFIAFARGSIRDGDERATQGDAGAVIRKAVSQNIERDFSRPEADVLAGILIGSRESLPPDLKQSFRTTGLSHILVASGQNIALLLFYIGTLLSASGVSRKKRCGILIAASGAYAIVTGLDPPVIRAAIMGSSALIAAQFGRQSSGVRALLIAACVMAFVSPWIVRSDLSFQLSFSATVGLVLLAPVIESYLSHIVPFVTLRALLSQTLAAIIATEPIILSSFGTLSLIAPIANLFAAPLVPLVMAFSGVWGIITVFERTLVAVIGGPLPIEIASMVALPAWGAVHVLIEIARFFSRIPFAQIVIVGGTPRALALGLLLLLLCFLLVQSGKKGRVTRDA